MGHHRFAQWGLTKTRLSQTRTSCIEGDPFCLQGRIRIAVACSPSSLSRNTRRVSLRSVCRTSLSGNVVARGSPPRCRAASSTTTSASRGVADRFITVKKSGAQKGVAHSLVHFRCCRSGHFACRTPGAAPVRTQTTLSLTWIAARLALGTAKGARAILHRWSQSHATPSKPTPTAQPQFQSMVTPRITVAAPLGAPTSTPQRGRNISARGQRDSAPPRVTRQTKPVPLSSAPAWRGGEGESNYRFARPTRLTCRLGPMV